MTSPSSLLKKGLILSSLMMVTVGSIVPSTTHAADGVFGTYFERMMGTTSCPIGSVLQPFTNTAGSSYGNRNCVPLSTLLGNTAGYTAPAGQAVVGFSNTGVLQFASLGDIPSGSIVPFNLSSCPAGWTPANGTAGTPDLRGEFIRGWYSGMTGRQVSPANTTPSSAVGSWQADMFRSHSHNQTVSNRDNGGNGYDGTYPASANNPINQTGSPYNTAVTGGTETRPRNVALLYCMKIAGSAPTPNFTWTSMGGTSSSNVTLATTGRVGIGTLSPTAKLEVIGTNKVDKIQLGNKVILSGIGDAHGNDSWIRMFDVAQQTNGTDAAYGNYGLAAASLWARDNITAGGNITIGNTVNIGNTAVNYLPASANWNYTIRLNGQDTTSIGFHDAGASVSSIRYSNAGFVIGADDGWGVKGTTFGGNVTAPGFYYSSDRSLKKDITPLSGSLDKILLLNGYSYKFKSDNRSDIGVIAQEVEEVFPELVHENEKGIKSVEYANLIAPLIEAIKEQQIQINALELELREMNGGL